MLGCVLTFPIILIYLYNGLNAILRQWRNLKQKKNAAFNQTLLYALSKPIWLNRSPIIDISIQIYYFLSIFIRWLKRNIYLMILSLVQRNVWKCNWMNVSMHGSVLDWTVAIAHQYQVNRGLHCERYGLGRWSVTISTCPDMCNV